MHDLKCLYFKSEDFFFLTSEMKEVAFLPGMSNKRVFFLGQWNFRLRLLSWVSAVVNRKQSIKDRAQRNFIYKRWPNTSISNQVSWQWKTNRNRNIGCSRPLKKRGRWSVLDIKIHHGKNCKVYSVNALDLFIFLKEWVFIKSLVTPTNTACNLRTSLFWHCLSLWRSQDLSKRFLNLLVTMNPRTCREHTIIR